LFAIQIGYGARLTVNVSIPYNSGYNIYDSSETMQCLQLCPFVSQLYPFVEAHWKQRLHTKVQLWIICVLCATCWTTNNSNSWRMQNADHTF